MNKAKHRRAILKQNQKAGWIFTFYNSRPTSFARYAVY
jgi:hypothetical protein